MTDDAEDAAYRELQRRKSRVTNVIGVICVLVGLAISAALFLFFLELQFRYAGEAELHITVGFSALVGVGGSVLAGLRVQRTILRLRAPSWIRELSANHRDRREQMEMIAGLWY